MKDREEAARDLQGRAPAARRPTASLAATFRPPSPPLPPCPSPSASNSMAATSSVSLSLRRSVSAPVPLSTCKPGAGIRA